MPLHRSVEHKRPSSVHAAPAAFTVSGGQAPELPVQLSARSHSFVAARHEVPAVTKPSAGQLVEVPSQLSATSQTPAEARQTVPAFPAGCVHAGVVRLPLQTSAVQTMPSSEHAAPAVLTASVGQVPELPVQDSATSHSFTAERQDVPAGASVSAGQLVEVPLQVSATSHVPTAARHVVPALPATCTHAGAPTVPLHRSVVQT